MRSIYDPTEHELVIEARKLVTRLNSEIGDCFVTRAGVDGPDIILEIKDFHRWTTRELYTRIQKLLDSGKFAIRLPAITVTKNLDDYLPRYDVQEKVY